MLSDQFLQELKYRSDIEQVVSAYVNLKRAGKNWHGLCPFHSEKTPSFTIYPDNQSFYCFGCGSGGDVITFVRRAENLDYIEAVRFLAQRAGMPMPEEVKDDGAAAQKNRILEINRATARFYHTCLTSPAYAKALQYLVERGLTHKIITRFGLGYAPHGWDALYKHLIHQGFALDDLFAAGVIAHGKNGGQYDQFRDRIMFPIIDLRGNVIGFGGRIMDGNGPKYLNSSDTPVFKKSRNLFALNYAKSTKAGELILAEGYMDVIAMHQAGFKNAVATLGTSLTGEQARLLSQYAAQVVIAYDSDSAGQTATKRAAALLDQAGVKVRVLSMQGAKDPDEFIKKFGAARFQMLLDGSSNATEFEIAKIRQKYDLQTTDGKVAFIKEFVSLAAGIRNPVERDVYISKVAQELEVDKTALQSQLAYETRRKQRGETKKEAKDLKLFSEKGIKPAKLDPQRSRHMKFALAEDKLIAILLKNPDYYGYMSGKISSGQFVTDRNRKIIAVLYDRLAFNRSIDLVALTTELDEAQMSAVSGLIASVSGINFTAQDADDYIKIVLEFGRLQPQEKVAKMSDDELKNYVESIAANKK